MSLAQILSRLAVTAKVTYVSKEEFDKIRGKKGTSARGIPQKVDKEGNVYRVRGEGGSSSKSASGRHSRIQTEKQIKDLTNQMNKWSKEAYELSEELVITESAEERQKLSVQRARLREKLFKAKDRLRELERML